MILKKYKRLSEVYSPVAFVSKRYELKSARMVGILEQSSICFFNFASVYYIFFFI